MSLRQRTHVEFLWCIDEGNDDRHAGGTGRSGTRPADDNPPARLRGRRSAVDCRGADPPDGLAPLLGHRHGARQEPPHGADVLHRTARLWRTDADIDRLLLRSPRAVSYTHLTL